MEPEDAVLEGAVGFARLLSYFDSPRLPLSSCMDPEDELKLENELEPEAEPELEDEDGFLRLISYFESLWLSSCVEPDEAMLSTLSTVKLAVVTVSYEAEALETTPVLLSSSWYSAVTVSS